MRDAYDKDALFQVPDPHAKTVGGYKANARDKSGFLVPCLLVRETHTFGKH